MTPIPEFDYDLLWGERVRAQRREPDARGRPRVPRARARRCRCSTEVEEFPLEEANEALVRLKSGELRGAAVLVP